jgi:carbamoyl-phosphate synthase large subunit
LAARVTTYTTIAGAQAAVEGIRHLLDASLTVIDVQAMHRQIAEK